MHEMTRTRARNIKAAMLTPSPMPTFAAVLRSVELSATGLELEVTRPVDVLMAAVEVGVVVSDPTAVVGKLAD